MRFCEECGAELEDDALFCEECGATVEPLKSNEAAENQLPKAVSVDLTTHAQPLAAPKQAKVVLTQPAAPQMKPAKGGKGKIIVAVVLAVAVIGVGIFGAVKFFGSKGSEDGNADSDKSTAQQIAQNVDDKNVTDETAANDTISDGATVDSDMAPGNVTVENEPIGSGEEGDPLVGEEGDPLVGEEGDPLVDEPSDAIIDAAGDSHADSCREKYLAENLDYNMGYIIADSSYRYLTEADLYGFSKAECRIARNEIFARYGRKFSSADLQSYFNNCSWYHPVYEASALSDSMLNEYEKANIDFIKNYEDTLADTYATLDRNVMRTVSFSTWSFMDSVEFILFYESENLGHALYRYSYEDYEGNNHTEYLAVRFVEAGNMSGEINLPGAGQVGSYLIRYESSEAGEYDSGHFEIDLKLGDSIDITLLETNWALNHVG